MLQLQPQIDLEEPATANPRILHELQQVMDHKIGWIDSEVMGIHNNRTEELKILL
jgi:hypothetical protein